MSRVSSRSAAEKAVHDFKEQFRPGTAVRHHLHADWNGTVRPAHTGNWVRIARMASGYEVEIHIVWEQGGPMWTRPDHLVLDGA